MAGLVFFLWIFSFGAPDLDLETFVQRISLPLHQFCLDNLPSESKWIHLYGAIVCAAEPPPSPERFWFQASGLYHLLVVSGSHLLLLSRWLNRFTTQRMAGPLVICALGIYGLVCQGNPPVIRALIHLLLHRLLFQTRLGWSPPQISLVTGVLCLGLFPNWVVSISFWLSWLASLLCGWAYSLPMSVLWRVTLIQTMLIPGLGMGISNLGLSIVGNWLLGAFLGEILFGCALLATVFHPLHFIGDLLWTVVIDLLRHAIELTGASSNFSANKLALMLYVSGLNFIWLGVWRWRER